MCWALEASGVADPPLHRVLVQASDADAGLRLTRALRARRVACALAPEQDADRYAVGWDYTHHLVLNGARAELKHLLTGSALPLDAKNVADIAQNVAAHLGVLEEV